MNQSRALGETFLGPRWTGCFGLAAGLAFAVGGTWLHLANVPSVSASAERVLEAASENRGWWLGCYVLWLCAIILQLLFLVGLQNSLVLRGQNPLSSLVLASASTLTALMLAGFVCFGALAYRAPDLAPSAALVLSDLFHLLLSAASLPAALLTLALSLPLISKGGLARGVGYVGLASSVTHVEAAVALTRSGVWSPDGWGGYLAPALFVVWTIGNSLVLLRREEPPKTYPG